MNVFVSSDFSDPVSPQLIAGLKIGSWMFSNLSLRSALGWKKWQQLEMIGRL